MDGVDVLQGPLFQWFDSITHVVVEVEIPTFLNIVTTSIIEANCHTLERKRGFQRDASSQVNVVGGIILVKGLDRTDF